MTFNIYTEFPFFSDKSIDAIEEIDWFYGDFSDEDFLSVVVPVGYFFEEPFD